MPVSQLGNTIEKNTEFDSLNPIASKAASILQTGGIVYLGENHSKPEARHVVLGLIEQRSKFIGTIGLEINTEDTEKYLGSDKGVKLLKVDPKFYRNSHYSFGDIVEAARAHHINVGFYDKQEPGRGNTIDRQNHIADQIQGYYQNRPSRSTWCGLSSTKKGVLILIGSDHLNRSQDMYKSKNWEALQALVSSGTSVRHGYSDTCTMVYTEAKQVKLNN
ncbi:hypothetical protein [Marinibactrum halimedae]|uniref:Uncharacterized protein n=1 Tax=Marinibactrum halimedae TaxID=1444977 RepID=A0AA37T0T6_9GAMM|nr:hypothetical protein [Marinibactrum halimedae]MCD9459133.1 hypothetical protein [Marinibactrum halimedae]GLS24735.1 hypothetical protein GCM10007877_04490 [Marinibactrum halimedae]